QFHGKRPEADGRLEGADVGAALGQRPPSRRQSLLHVVQRETPSANKRVPRAHAGLAMVAAASCHACCSGSTSRRHEATRTAFFSMLARTSSSWRNVY